MLNAKNSIEGHLARVRQDTYVSQAPLRHTPALQTTPTSVQTSC